MIEVINGDCLKEMAKLKENSVDSIVTDPPYGINFMGKKWDSDVPGVEIWKQAFRVLKPGGWLLAFSGTRTHHRLTVNIEDAGFEIRDMIGWIYGSGFPKSLDISKAIDKNLGVDREILGKMKGAASKNTNSLGEFNSTYDETEPKTEEAKEWAGWGTALKPAFEPITVARKPLSEKTVAQNVLKHGTGGINIEGCRIKTQELKNKIYKNKGDNLSFGGTYGKGDVKGNATGRWPANLIHDGSEEVQEFFNKAPVVQPCGSIKKSTHTKGMFGAGTPSTFYGYDGDSPARFFYCAKASKSDRDAGLYRLKYKQKKTRNTYGEQSEYNCSDGSKRIGNKGTSLAKNFHPTVKPTELMRWLVRLVTPKGGTCLDPFMGSGSTGRGAKLEGFDFIGIEIDEEIFELAEKRISSILAVQNEIDWGE